MFYLYLSTTQDTREPKLLADLDKGEKGRIAEISSGIESSASSAGYGHGARHGQTEPRNVKRLKNLGVQVGKDLTVISKQPFCLIVIEIDNREITREITKSPFF